MPRPREKPTELFAVRYKIHKYKKFLDSLENKSQFVLQLIDNSLEYKDFIKKQQEQEDKNQPTLF